jgi:hypothetical protein
MPQIGDDGVDAIFQPFGAQRCSHALLQGGIAVPCSKVYARRSAATSSGSTCEGHWL